MKKIASFVFAAILAVVSFGLSLFDKGVEGIVSQFTKLDAKLDREIAKLDRKRAAQANLRLAARRLITTSNEATDILIRDQDRAIRIKERIRNLTA